MIRISKLAFIAARRNAAPAHDFEEYSMTFSGAVGVQSSLLFATVLAALCAAVLAVSITASYDCTCSPEIGRAQADINAKLEAKAAAADPTMKESTAATMHHQPTPHSLATTESQLGLISPDEVKMLEATMAQAREADTVDDRSACEQALAAVHRIVRSM